MISILLGSSRPGGIDISLAGLTRQKYQDFEVIFSDYRYHKRRDAVREAVKRSGLRQPFLHVPHHRYRDDEMGSVAAGFNTAFALARGERVVMLMDYAFAPPEWVEAHATSSGIAIGAIETRELRGVVTRDWSPPMRFGERRAFAHQLKAILAAREIFDEISIFAEQFEPERFPHAPEQDWRIGKDEPCEPWFFCTKNESFPRQAILDVNGMSEDCDRACLRGDEELARRLVRRCGQARIVSAAKVVCYDPHPYLPKPAEALTNTDVPPPPLDTYYPIHHERSRGWFEWATKRERVSNPVDLQALSEKIEPWRTASDLPRNVVADADYYPDPLPYESHAVQTTAPTDQRGPRKRIWVGRWA